MWTSVFEISMHGLGSFPPLPPIVIEILLSVSSVGAETFSGMLTDSLRGCSSSLKIGLFHTSLDPCVNGESLVETH
jgi:hypothetical protein